MSAEWQGGTFLQVTLIKLLQFKGLQGDASGFGSQSVDID